MIKTIKKQDKEFPSALKKIIDPPELLYYRGSLELGNNPTIAVVGTRRCSNYGKQATIEIVSQLARAGFIIVSGMARGIDAIAHQSALDNQAKTIAILGTGLDKKTIYPQQNLKLAEEIVKQGGALISEFPAKTPGYKANFIQRNRLISGLALGVLVIEAKSRSGALNTANHAFKQGKKVFALPGSVYSLNSKGPHHLIKKGARLIESAEDILKELQMDLKLGKLKIKPESQEEETILKTLKNQALNIDEIIKQSGLETSQAISVLTNLEAKDKIKNLGGNTFTICR